MDDTRKRSPEERKQELSYVRSVIDKTMLMDWDYIEISNMVTEVVRQKDLGDPVQGSIVQYGRDHEERKQEMNHVRSVIDKTMLMVWDYFEISNMVTEVAQQKGIGAPDQGTVLPYGRSLSPTSPITGAPSQSEEVSALDNAGAAPQDLLKGPPSATKGEDNAAAGTLQFPKPPPSLAGLLADQPGTTGSQTTPSLEPGAGGRGVALSEQQPTAQQQPQQQVTTPVQRKEEADQAVRTKSRQGYGALKRNAATMEIDTSEEHTKKRASSSTRANTASHRNIKRRQGFDRPEPSQG